MWQSPLECIALLELLTQGSLKRRASQSDAYDTLAELPWTRGAGRHHLIGLVEAYRTEVAALLTRVWPEWETTFASLTLAGLPPTPEGLRQLDDAQRASKLPALPARLNRRTAAALTGPHSKVALTPSRHAAMGATQCTHDGLLRLRPPRGLRARIQDDVLDLWALALLLGEAPLPERAFRDGLKLEGALRAVLLVENRGAWRDLPELDGWLIVHIPGWDTSTVDHLFAQITPEVPFVHFGDLDPNGVRIFLRLKQQRPELRWFIPDYWEECVAPKPLKRPWPPGLDLSRTPGLVRQLARDCLWLEQEPLVVDGRTPQALARCAAIGSAPPGADPVQASK